MQRLRVLLADDDASFRALLRALVEADPRFVVVAEAADGREALRRAELHEPDLVLLDLDMPRLGGLEVAKQLLARRPDLRVILISGSEPDNDLERALAAGVRRFLPKKEIDPATFCDEILA